MSNATRLKQLRSNWGECQRCSLHEQRNRMCWWRGNPESKLMLIGEAPGADEDETGLPFVGKAGQHLDKLFRMAGINDFFITNLLLCRPPGNRDPDTDEVIACQDRLHLTGLILKPVSVITLGREPSGHLIDQWIIGDVVGEWFHDYLTFTYNHCKHMYKVPLAVPIYHPSYLARKHDKKLDEKMAEHIKLAYDFAHSEKF